MSGAYLPIPLERQTESKAQTMKIKSTDEGRSDAALAHGLARMALGLNIAVHGYGRLPNITVRFDRFSLDGLRRRR
jgi:hypothetical protein